VATAIERGTAFVGLSDFTAFQNAVLAKTGAVTWAGPAVGEDFGTEEAPDDIMQACFEDLLLGQAEGTGWRWPAPDYKAFGQHAAIKNIAGSDQPAWTPADFEVKNAVLWGGNLTVLTSLLGTPWFPQVKGGILFLEDVHEHPYRIERMLSQLLHAGVLAQQKAVLLGAFTNFRLAPHDRGYSLKSVVTWLRQNIKAPVLTGLPFGHVPTKVLLPVGEKVTLAVQGREALVLWAHAH
jgi:muramoyltetrapeptide carboxypeptidase